jgi:hypothetical protein
VLPYRFIAEIDSFDSIIDWSNHSIEILNLSDFQLYYIKTNTNFLYMIKSTEKNYTLNSKNKYRSDIWWMIKELFPEVISYKSRNFLLGWTNFSAPYYKSNSASITTKKLCEIEFNLLSEWIKRIVSKPIREQKFGKFKNDYKAWFRKRRADIPRADT